MDTEVVAETSGRIRNIGPWHYRPEDVYAYDARPAVKAYKLILMMMTCDNMGKTYKNTIIFHRLN